jgi:hypothetical protein
MKIEIVLKDSMSCDGCPMIHFPEIGEDYCALFDIDVPWNYDFMRSQRPAECRYTYGA